MAVKYYCDVCGSEVPPEEYRAPRPDSTKIVAQIEGCMCFKCVKAFNAIDLEKLIRDDILYARSHKPEEN